MKQFFFLITATVLLTSCIREEALNTEADIETCTISGGVLKREPIIQNDKISLWVNAQTDLTQQAPVFTLTPGATIEPASGTIRDFTTPKTYTVTSEDGVWKKTYTVTFVMDELNTVYHFEDTIAESNNRYYIFAEKSGGQTIMEWASGNNGFMMTGSGNSPNDYPTIQSPNGYIGKCACLITRSTGSFGAMVGMPIAAGNLFIGTFNVLNALSSPLKATQFGLPFYSEPISISGYYKYKAGDTYYENGIPKEGKKDSCHFYAVLYETNDTLKTLDGTNVLTHPNVVAAAIYTDEEEISEWTRFTMDFVYREGKTIDEQKLKNGGYNLTIVFTSSIEGATFTGAPGSTLYIDEVEITCE